MIPTEIINKICAEYGIGEQISIEKINRGMLNDNYVLATNKGKYFVKSVRQESKDRLNTIYSVESFMKENGIPAVAMMKTISGNIFIEDEGSVFTLYPFIEVKNISSFPESDYRTMGVMLGRIHKAGNIDFSKIEGLKMHKRPNDEVITERLQNYLKLINEKDEHDEVDKTFIKYINFKLSILSKVNKVELENDTLTHGDFHPGNLLIDSQTREIIGVCDWEKTEFAPKAYELARAVFYSCFDEGIEEDRAINFTKAFIEGYTSVIEISKKEIIDGFHMRIHRMELSSWIEEKYYNNNDSRANHFIKHEMDVVDSFENGNLLERITNILN